jgi:hypothetical protein
LLIAAGVTLDREMLEWDGSRAFMKVIEEAVGGGR